MNHAAAANLGDFGQLLSVVAPILVAAIGGLFGYRQAVKVADRSSTVEGRKLTLAEYEALNRGLKEEIDRLRADRQEDEQQFDRRIERLEMRIDRLDTQRSEAAESLNRLIGWGRQVVAVIRRPDVAAALLNLGVDIPSPPELKGATGQMQMWNVRNPDG